MTIAVIIILSILFSAFFSGMEIAYVSQNRMQVEIERKRESFISKLFIFLADRPKKFITTMLLGNTISLVVYGYFMGDLITHFIEDSLHIKEGIFLVLIQTLISTLIIIVTAEFIPKALFSLHSYKLFSAFTFPAYIIYWLLSPFTWFVSQITTLFLKLFKVDNEKEEATYLKEELSYFISEKLEDVDQEDIDTEIQIFQNALNFSDVKARDCLIPRNEIVAVEIEEDLAKVKEQFTQTGYSKLVVYRESIDNIIGYVHHFDLFKKPDSIKKIILPIETVYETTSAKEIMNRLIKNRKSIAIVLDEYGGTSGMLTLEDIVEELFGDIEDEHDTPTYTEEKITEHQYRFSSRMEIDYLNEKYNLDLPENEQYETLGGMIVHFHENIPSKNEEISIKNYHFLIEKVSNTKIEEVLVTIQQE